MELRAEKVKKGIIKMNFDNNSLPKPRWKVSEKQQQTNLKHPIWHYWLGLLDDLNHFWSRSTTRDFVKGFQLEINWTHNDSQYGGDGDDDGEDCDEFYDDAYCDDGDDYCDDEDDEEDAEDDYCDDEDD